MFYPPDPVEPPLPRGAPPPPPPGPRCPFGVLPIQEAAADMDIAEECMETVLSYLQV